MSSILTDSKDRVSSTILKLQKLSGNILHPGNTAQTGTILTFVEFKCNIYSLQKTSSPGQRYQN